MKNIMTFADKNSVIQNYLPDYKFDKNQNNSIQKIHYASSTRKREACDNKKENERGIGPWNCLDN